jgi:hypothetical protein
VNVAVEMPSNRDANHYAGENAKSNRPDQTLSHRAPLIITRVNFMNGLAGIRVNRRFRCFDARRGTQFFVIM